MKKRIYSQEFKEFVKNGIGKYFIGTGNPNANILFVGKESAIAKENIQGRKFYNDNAISWNEHIENNTCEILNYPVDENHLFRKEKSWGRNTWSKYQKLKTIIFDEENKINHIDFLEKVFTTEINDSPEKNTAYADKSSLNERKRLFEKSEFIQKFPVVILACSNYITNNDKIREIDNIFKVTYYDKEVYSNTNWFYTHYNNDKSKLVIHTRQLSANVKTDLLKGMGKMISKHLKKQKLIE